MTKNSLIDLDKSHVILIAHDNEYWMKEKLINKSSSFDSIIYILSHVIKMQLF